MYNFPHDRLESSQESFVVHTVMEGEIYAVVLAFLPADVINGAGTGKVVTELVKGRSHNSVCRVKRLFDTITVMAVYVYIEHSLVSLQ